MIKLRQIFQATGTALAISSLLSVPANAGSNGQQLAITTNATVRQITVTGKNQRGQTVTWTQRASGNASGNAFTIPNITFRTDNWWWQGNVTISINRSNGENLRCSTDVPKIQIGSNWRSLNCGATLLIR
ncbi:MAG: hypothetical protein Fur0025_27410 [Oscillatoriaceae cyanobacterium]